MTKEQLGTFIAENRRNRDMTQRDLAERLHITDKAVSKWERGLSYPDVTLLEPLAEALGMRIEELMACRRLAADREEERPVKAVLEISRENQQGVRRRDVTWTAVSALVMLGLALLVIWYSGTYTHEQRRDKIYMKETVENINYLYLEQEGHLLRLKCGDNIDFDTIELTDYLGHELVYQLDCRWNRKTYTGTVKSCEATEDFVVGGLMDVEPGAMAPSHATFLFGHTLVLYGAENYFYDPYGEPRGQVILCDYRFSTGVLDEKSGVWTEGEELLLIEDCMNVTIADYDGDGENEVIARTRFPEKPYAVYKLVRGEIVRLWPETVPEDVRGALRYPWENDGV